MSTIRLLSPEHRRNRERRQEAIGFFRDQEANPALPLAARNVAGFIARGLEIIYGAHFLTGDEKDWMFRNLIQKARHHGALARA